MNSALLSSVTDAVGVYVSEEYKDWRPSQAWLAEMTRSVTTCLYAQAKALSGKNEKKVNAAVHHAAIISQTLKAYGALYVDTLPQAVITCIIDLLVQLEDIGHIGNGYYIPRESRVVQLTTGWGRIAGGLPLELSEYEAAETGEVLTSTVGRVVRLLNGFSRKDREAEYSEVFQWLQATTKKKHQRLYNRLTGCSVPRPPADITKYYNVKYRHAKYRRQRWNMQMPDADFVVSYTGIQPRHYYIVETESGKWYELENEEARRWILLVEEVAGVVNTIPKGNGPLGSKFTLPNMLPKAWTTGIISCASTIEKKEEGGWILEVPDEANDILKTMLSASNIKLI